MKALKILAFAGSSREGSYNQMLIKSIMGVAPQQNWTYVDLRALELPIYDGDLEAQGTPEGANKFKEMIRSHDAIIIATPEYNGGFPALIKNALDWASRRGKDEASCYSNKIAAIAATSPGRLGGIRVLPKLRAQLQDLGVTVIPNQVAVASASKAWENGQLVDERAQRSIDSLVADLVQMGTALKIQD